MHFVEGTPPPPAKIAIPSFVKDVPQRMVRATLSLYALLQVPEAASYMSTLENDAPEFVGATKHELRMYGATMREGQYLNLPQREPDLARAMTRRQGKFGLD